MSTRNVWDDDTIRQFQEVHQESARGQAAARRKCKEFQITFEAYQQWVAQGCEPPTDEEQHP